MSKKEIVRAWKDPKYRRSLSAAEQAALEPHPAGAMQTAGEQSSEASDGRFFPTVRTCDCGTYSILC